MKVTEDLWIAFVVPFANILVITLLRSLFKMSEARFAYSISVHELTQMLRELKQEMSLRFLMGYTLAWGILATLLWYYVTFTQQYGTHVSVFWFLTGGLACIIRFVVYDFIICMIYHTLARSSR